MQLNLPPAHRFARTNYLPRTAAFAYTFLVVELLVAERALSGWVIAFAVLQFLVYPHLAYLHARLAVDSKRAEFRNLALDSLLLGAWVAELRFPLWIACGLLAATCLNQAANGGVRRFLLGLACFAGGALAWSSVAGLHYEPATGPLVSGMSAAGIVGYVSWIGFILWQQNRRLVRARDALAASEEQFRFIADNAGDLVTVLDPGGAIRYASRSHLKYFDPDAVGADASWPELVHPDDRARAKDFLQRIARSGKSEKLELRLTSTDGSSRIVACVGNPVWDRHEGARLIILAAQDVTDRARAEIDLRLAARAFDEYAEGVVISDGSGRVEYVNAAYCELTGFSRSEMVGRTLEQLKIGLESDRLIERIRDAVRRMGGWSGRYMDQHKNGRWIEISARISAISDASGEVHHYLWILSDASKVRVEQAG